MKGNRILEVAQFTFVPVAGAILADWGADVIKIEHPVRGDTQRGFINIESSPVNPERNVMVEHRSEEHTSELQSLMRISYAVFCLKKKNETQTQTRNKQDTHNTLQPHNE